MKRKQIHLIKSEEFARRIKPMTMYWDGEGGKLWSDGGDVAREYVNGAGALVQEIETDYKIFRVMQPGEQIGG